MDWNKAWEKKQKLAYFSDRLKQLGQNSCQHASINALMKIVQLEIPLDKEVTAICLIETCIKLKELTPAAMIKCGLTIRYSSPGGCSNAAVPD